MHSQYSDATGTKAGPGPALVGEALGEAAVGAVGGEYEAVDAALDQDVAVLPFAESVAACRSSPGLLGDQQS